MLLCEFVRDVKVKIKFSNLSLLTRMNPQYNDRVNILHHVEQYLASCTQHHIGMSYIFLLLLNMSLIILSCLGSNFIAVIKFYVNVNSVLVLESNLNHCVELAVA